MTDDEGMETEPEWDTPAAFLAALLLGIIIAAMAIIAIGMLL